MLQFAMFLMIVINMMIVRLRLRLRCYITSVNYNLNTFKVKAIGVSSITYGCNLFWIIISQRVGAFSHFHPTLTLTDKAMPTPWWNPFEGHHQGRLKHSLAISDQVGSDLYWQTLQLITIHVLIEPYSVSLYRPYFPCHDYLICHLLLGQISQSVCL